MADAMLEARLLKNQLDRELADIASDRNSYPTIVEVEYAVHVTLLLFTAKITNYLKDSASDEFKERFLS